MNAPFACLVMAAVLLMGAGGGWGQQPQSPPASSPIDQYQIDYKRRNLGRSLNLDQQKVEQLIQIDQKYAALKRQTEAEASTAWKQFQQLMSQPNPPEAEVKRILDYMLQKRQEKLALEQRQFEEQKAILPSAVQQGRYLLFLMGLHRQIAQEAQRLKTAPGKGEPLHPLRPEGPVGPTPVTR